MVARDALMQRTVEQQISSFGVVHDTARKQYLYAQWTQFLEKARQQSSPGTLTNFIGDLQRAEVTSIYVPRRMFRQLSPGNPYAPKTEDGHHEEVRPQQIALRLISCREQLAEYWVELMPSLANVTGQATSVPEPNSNATIIEDTLSSYDRQLLLGIATELAAKQVLKNLKLRPSCQHMHDWLKSYLLVQHGDDLTAYGSVERLHADLVAQPIMIRGGALVDPQDISMELFQRSMEILERIEEDLRAAPEHIVPFTSSFLESCLRLPE